MLELDAITVSLALPVLRLSIFVLSMLIVSDEPSGKPNRNPLFVLILSALEPSILIMSLPEPVFSDLIIELYIETSSEPLPASILSTVES